MIFDIILSFLDFLIIQAFFNLFLNCESFDNVNCCIMIIVLIEFNHISYRLIIQHIFLLVFMSLKMILIMYYDVGV